MGQVPPCGSAVWSKRQQARTALAPLVTCMSMQSNTDIVIRQLSLLSRVPVFPFAIRLCWGYFRFQWGGSICTKHSQSYS